MPIKRTATFDENDENDENDKDNTVVVKKTKRTLRHRPKSTKNSTSRTKNMKNSKKKITKCKTSTIRRATSKTHEIITSITPNTCAALYEFHDAHTYYIIPQDELYKYKMYPPKYTFKQVIGADKALRDYVVAHYLSGESWILPKTDLAPNFIENQEIIARHNAAVTAHITALTSRMADAALLMGYPTSDININIRNRAGTWGCDIATLGSNNSDDQAMIYVRTSKVDASSEHTQRAICLEYAQKHNLLLCPWGIQVDSGVSARNMNNLNRELGFWCDYLPHNSHVIIANVDRLSRNYAKAIEFMQKLGRERGVQFHFVSDALIYNSDDSFGQNTEVDCHLLTAEQFSIIASAKVKRGLLHHKHHRSLTSAAGGDCAPPCPPTGADNDHFSITFTKLVNSCANLSLHDDPIINNDMIDV